MASDTDGRIGIATPAKKIARHHLSAAAVLPRSPQGPQVLLSYILMAVAGTMGALGIFTLPMEQYMSAYPFELQGAWPFSMGLMTLLVAPVITVSNSFFDKLRIAGDSKSLKQTIMCTACAMASLHSPPLRRAVYSTVSSRRHCCCSIVYSILIARFFHSVAT